MLTGGDVVTAHFMRQDDFEYAPKFKLFFSGNHKPGLRSVGEAMRRRVNMIPFAVVIPKDERDPHFGDKLEDEWPGVLQWMIDGCLDWQERGLAPPEAVTKATDEYFMAQDSFTALDRGMLRARPERMDHVHAAVRLMEGMGRKGGGPLRRHQELRRDDGGSRICLETQEFRQGLRGPAPRGRERLRTGRTTGDEGDSAGWCRVCALYPSYARARAGRGKCD